MSTDSTVLGRTLLLFAAAAAAVLLLTAPAWAAPANDAFTDAQVLPAAPAGEVMPLISEASKEPGEPDHAGNPGGHSVWYSWTPGTSGEAGIAPSCSSGANILIGVYTGASVGALTEVASNEHAGPPNCFGDDDETVFGVQAGTTYLIAIDGRDGAQGFFPFLLRAAPANDDFAAATTVAADLPQNLYAFNRFATRESDEPLHAGEPGGRSLWYAWTAATSGPVEISTCSSFSSIDAMVAVYTGTDLNALTPIAANDDAPAPAGYPGCSGLDSRVVIEAVAGTTYRIAVDGASDTFGNFSLRLVGRPANDGFDTPVVLTAAPFGSSQGTNRLATKQGGEPNHGGDVGGASVWFSWTPTTSGPAEIVTCREGEGDLEPTLGVYAGPTVDVLTTVATGSDDLTQSCGSAAVASFAAVAGTTYRIAVDARGGGEGRFTLDLRRPPANDAFAQPQALASTLPVWSNATTQVASKEPGEPDHAGNPGGHSVWFTWTAPSSEQVVVSTCGFTERGPYTLLAIYTGGSLGGLTPVASNDEGTDCGRGGSEAKFAAVAGTTYRIAVDARAESRQGAFGIEISGAPANDDFAAAEVLPGATTSAGGSTVLASKEPGEPAHAGNPGGHSVWFTWTPTESGPAVVTACGSNDRIDTLLGVYTGSAVGSLSNVAANDDAAGQPATEFCESSSGISEVRFEAVAGTPYRIAVDGKGGGEGEFGLRFQRAPSGDNFAAAQPLSIQMPAHGSAVTDLAGREPGEPDHAGNPGGHSVWFTWTAPSTGPFAVSTCTHRGDLDTLLGVYTGSALAALNQVASDDDSASDCRATDSEAQFTAVAGTTYRIAVDGKAGSFGSFNLGLAGVAKNDSFGSPHPLGSWLPGMTWTSNRFATKQAGEFNHAGNPGGASVWFKWTAPRTGKVSIDTCASRFDTLLAVYKGATVDTLTEVGSNDDASGNCAPQSRVQFDAVANAVYKIAVDGKAGAQGAVELHVDERSGNDDFADAESILAGTGWYWPGSTALASKEPGEPAHAGNPGGHSVWFTWMATQSGPVEIDSCSASFDPLLAVYTGSALDALTPVPSTTADLGECEAGGFTIRFEALTGTTYRIAVDGASGDQGRFDLHLRKGGASPPTLSVQKTGAGAGSVSSSPGGIACGSTCGYAFAAGTVVILSATPEAGSAFAGWSGGGCSGTGVCQVTLKAETTVAANFDLLSSGGGSIVTPPTPAPPVAIKPKPKPRPKPLKCKPGFKKTKVKGKAKCVKKKSGQQKGNGKRRGRGQR